MKSIICDPYIQRIVPPVSLQNLVRVDNVVTADPHGKYKADCAWFRQNPKRRLLIRREYDGEFDPPTVEQWHPARNVVLSKPPLWVLVIQLSEGFHLVTVCYRGSAFFEIEVGSYKSDPRGIPAASCDNDISALLAEMFMRQCVNIDEATAWLQRYEEAVISKSNAIAEVVN